MNSIFATLYLFSATYAAPTGDRCSMANEGGPQGAIVERVCRGLALRDEYRFLVEDEIKARQKVNDTPIGSEERYQRLLVWEAANALLESKRDAMNSELNGAIDDTLRHYAIAPTQGNGWINGGPGKDLHADWKPAYRHRLDPEEPLLRKTELANGQTVYVRWNQGRTQEERSYGITWFDGQVDIMDGVLERVAASRSPRLLAYLLHHESVHFDQLRSGQWSTLNAREVAAYQVSIADAKRFGLSQIEIQDLRAHLAYNQRKLEAQRAGSEPFPLNLPPAPVQANIRSDWEAMIAGESRRIALSLNLAEERRNRAEASTPDPRNSPSDTQNPIERIESLAKYFCEHPEHVRSLTRAQEVWRDSLGKVSPILAVLNRDLRIGTMPCSEYVAYQAIYLHRNHYDAGAVPSILGLIEEGLLRQTESRPRIDRVSVPAPSSGEPQNPTQTPSDPQVPDTIDFPQERTPPIPHCRHHDWCKDPARHPANND